MELKNRYEKFRKPLMSVALFGGVALGLAGCSVGSYQVIAHQPVEVLDKQESERFVSAQESPGFPHYEDVYHMTIEQCDRGDETISDDSGCIELQIEVNEAMFNQYSVGDVLTFDKDLKGYPTQDSK
ncbi:MAG: hypothetical protein JWO54_907 [Candidatus Saccharibacteria bacterium]|nr:hypothetical protein [Candidatus Saccharibacteria bacterium]MDB5181144.1 hypothetical protein [Candidatus Saccharibacteria bacterium]